LPAAGLSRKERGSLVHATLAAFWAEVADHASLLALDEATLGAQIDRAVERGLACLSAARWRSLPALLRHGEAHRLRMLLAAWLEIERARPPFAARHIEAKTTLGLGGLEFRLRLDRIDALGDGGIAIIDYKTGRVERPALWFDERPRSAQLGMYMLAQRAANPEIALRAVAYAQLCAGAVAPSGLAADDEAWPALDPVASVGRMREWGTLESWWQTHLGALAREIAQGHAAVTPRNAPSPCRACGLRAVCRIESAGRIEDDALHSA
jgi:RecB family exonuclease